MLNVTIMMDAQNGGRNMTMYAAEKLTAHMEIHSMSTEYETLIIEGTTEETFAVFTSVVYGDEHMAQAVHKLVTNADPLELSTRKQQKPTTPLYSCQMAKSECLDMDCSVHKFG